MPNTLSLHLISSGTAWSKDVNMTWLRTALGTYPPARVYVFHDKCVETLTLTGAKDFESNYRGNRKDTYHEVVAVLKAGYTRVEAVKLGCRLTK